jgi:dipeptidyl aminopeptidase/acylaminoacyl peptidase
VSTGDCGRPETVSAALFGVDWYQEFQVYAARQWAVFFCNPRGSLGYGEDFERKEINNWGVGDSELRE